MIRFPRKTIPRFLLTLGLLALAFAVVSCAASRGRRRGEAPESGFLRDY